MSDRKKKFRRYGKMAAVILIAVFALLIVAVLSMDSVVRSVVTTGGTMVTGTGVELENVSVRPLIGRVELKGMALLNPQGYINRSAVSFGAFTVQLKPLSLFSDKIEITTIRMEKLDLDLEIHSKGTNLGDIKAKVDSFTAKIGSPASKANAPAAEEEKPAKKIVIRKLQIVDSTIHLANPDLKLSMTIPLLDVEMTDVGDGRNLSELAQVLYDSIYDAVMQGAKKSGDVMGAAVKSTGKALKDAAGSFSDSAKNARINASDAARKLGKDAEKTVRNLGNQLKGLF